MFFGSPAATTCGDPGRPEDNLHVVLGSSLVMLVILLSNGTQSPSWSPISAKTVASGFAEG